MADDQVAARREARRQRILLNSQARLERIAGKPLTTRTHDYELQNGQVNSKNTVGVSEGQPSAVTLSADASDSSHNIVERDIREATPVEKFFKQIWEDDSISDIDVDNFITQRESRDSDLNNVLPRNKYVILASAMKLHFVLLALLTRTLFYLDLGYTFGETIFIPFLIVEISNMLVLKLSKQSSLHASGMMSAVLILCGISSSVVNTLTEVTNAIFIIGADFSMYFVSFILFHCTVEKFSYLFSHMEKKNFFK